VKENINPNRAFKLVLTLAALFIIISGLKAAKIILVPFLFAIFLAILAHQPVNFLSKYKIPRYLSIIIVSALFLSVFIVLGAIVASSIDQFTKSIPSYYGNLDALLSSLASYLQSKGLEVDKSYLVETIDIKNYMSFFTSTLAGLGSALSRILLVLIMMIFLLLESATLKEKFKTSLGNKLNLNRFFDVSKDIQRYLAIKTITSLITGLTVWGVTLYLGVDFANLWGFLAFILNYIPVVGSTIAAVPACILYTLQFGFYDGLTLIIIYFVINMTISSLVEPILLGRKLGLSVLVIFVSLLFWGWIWGPAGALMSVPLTMILKILCEHSDDFSWVSVLMGPKLKKS